jgi:pSer/pThr/pTyr-binding forkhead associated (FHA) protein
VYVQIVVYRDGKQEFCVPITESGASIGRDPGNAVQLPLPEISKKHAFLKRTSKGWHVKDLGSRNGLYVNGIKVPEAVLAEGARLRIGPYTLQVIEIDETELLAKPIMNIDFSDEAEQPTMPPQRIRK